MYLALIMKIGKPLDILKNIHLGEDIYVVASGKSLDYFDTSFFDNRIVIGVNQIYRKIKPTYLVYKDPKLLNEAVSSGASVLLSKHRYGNTRLPLNIIPNGAMHVYTYPHNCNTDSGSIDASNIMSKLIVSKSTMTTAIHAAAYMGAKNIFLVGHDCGLINNEANFSGYYSNISETPWKDWNAYKSWLLTIEAQTIHTKALIEQAYRCNIHSINPFINFNLEGNKYAGENNIN